MGRDETRFPIRVAIGNGLRQSMRFQQQPERGDLFQVCNGNGRNLEAALALSQNEAF
jgi:glycerol-3-phosphate dehydrogenase